MTLEFGTDGVRGVANTEITPELALTLGRAAARVLGGRRWLVGRDTRLSGPLLAAAFGAGLASEGAEVVDLGVAPTPAVAHLAAAGSLAGAVVSASHNPFGDNGIKIFASGGRKLDDDTEAQLEAEMAALAVHGDPRPRPEGAEVGTLVDGRDRLAGYLDHLRADVVDGRRLDGLRLVVDTANGAASGLAHEVFAALGADVDTIHAAPDGTNINDGCGSTFPASLQAAVLASGAQMGLALDGDADRVLAVDGDGHLVDGDQLIAMCAIDLHQRGLLRDDTVVVTVLSNLGFRQAMEAHGISVVDTAVGDRYVLEALNRGGWSLGGEQSGHLIFRELASTGDGLLAGLAVADLVKRSGRTLADLADSAMVRLPQVMLNVRLDGRDGGLVDRVAAEVSEVDERLSGRGRVLLRPSGTEPLIRVMVEAPTQDEAQREAEYLASVVRAAAGTS